jgi:hypothetical protein
MTLSRQAAYGWIGDIQLIDACQLPAPVAALCWIHDNESLSPPAKEHHHERIVTGTDHHHC